MKFTHLLTRVTSTKQYLPYIDGIRALCVFMVLIFHFSDYYKDRVYPSLIEDTGDLNLMFTSAGYSAVMLFFCISGFILGLPFIKQHAYNGRKVVIKQFLLRRLTRIEPPYLIAVTLFFILSLYAGTKGSFSELLPHYLYSMTYTSNFFSGSYFPVLSDVLWSLEIEVQFYLLAPLFALMFKLNKYVRRTFLILILFFYTDFIRSHIDPFGFRSLIKYIEYFLAGFLAADLYLEYKDKLKPSIIFDIISIYITLSFLIDIPTFPRAVNVFLVVFCGAFSTFWKQFLSWKWMCIVGCMCYSFYIIHQRLLYLVLGDFRNFDLIADNVYIDFTVRLLIYIIPLSIATMIYFIFVERPTMKRDWWKYRSLKKLFFT